MLSAFKLALSFLTIIPARSGEEVDGRAFAASIAYFPVVGAIVGAIAAAIWAFASLRLDALASSALAIMTLIVLTRALHLDGLADSFDGLLGGHDKERSLEIMKDSRVGSFGVIAIACAILLKVVLLAQVPRAEVLGVLVAVPVASRWAACFTLSTRPYARSTGGLGALFKQQSSVLQVIAASVIALVVAVLALRFAAVVVIPVTIASTIVFNWAVARKIDGITGDTVGALIELVEVALLLASAIYWG